MNYQKFTWLDRVSDNSTRRLLKDVSTGAEQLVDIARADTNIRVPGTPFSADTMNDLETRIDSAFSDGNEQIYSLGADVVKNASDITGIYNGTTRENYISNKCLLSDNNIIDAPGYCVTHQIAVPSIPGSTLGITYNCTTHSNVAGTGKAMSLIVYSASGSILQTFTARTQDRAIDLNANASYIVASFGMEDSAENSITLFVDNTPREAPLYRMELEKTPGLYKLESEIEATTITANGAYQKANTAYTQVTNGLTGSVCSVTSNAGTISKLHSYRAGKIIHVSFSIKLTSALSAWGEIATVTGALPLDHTAGMYVDTQTPANSTVCRMLKNGTVNALVSIASGHELEVSLSYITA